MTDKVKWSHTAVNTLRECNRKYYFFQTATHGRNNPVRRKIYELKNMQNLVMWSGSVVDKFMETVIIPAIAAKQPLNFEEFAEQAVALGKRQFEFSQLSSYTDPFVKKGETGADFCILDIHELGNPYKEQEIAEAYASIREAILRLPDVAMPDGQLLIEFLKSCNTLLPNVNNWAVTIEQAIVKPQIDLLAMGRDWKPVIMDWKLSRSYTSDYSRQLIICGLVVYLKRLDNPAKSSYKHEDIKMFEVNLFKGQIREHLFTPERANQMIDEIHLTSQDILLLQGENEPDIDDFELTDSVSSCQLCNYRSICAYLLLNNNQYNEKAYTQFVQDRQFA